MKINYGLLNQNGGVIKTLTEMKIKDFGTKIKVVKVKKWFDVEVELIKGFVQEINDEFKIKESFDFDNDGKFTGDNRDELLKVIESKKKREDELLGTEITLPEISFSEADLKDIDLNAEDILKLNKLGLFEI